MNVIDGILSTLKDHSKRLRKLEVVPYHSHAIETLITANTLTLTNGTSGNVVADLRTAHDNLYYTIAEVAGGAGVPGINMTVHFVSVQSFTRVKVIGTYAGSATHAVGIQVYNWVSGVFDTYNAFQTGASDVTPGKVVLDNTSFQMSSCVNYIGTGADLGKVEVRFYHTMSGNANHYLALDVVALVK
jgi:hypothetical protein